MQRRCLFGGAVFSAGIAPCAVGQDFVFQTNNGGASPVSVAYAYASDLPGIGSFDRESDTNFTPATALTAVSANYNDFIAESTVSLNRVDVVAEADSYFGVGLAVAGAYVHFSVPQHCTMCVFWSLIDEAPGASFAASSIELRNKTLGVALLAVAEGDSGFGIECFHLAPGVVYTYTAEAYAFEPFGRAVIEANLESGGCPGDCDGNGVINLDDVQCFVSGFLGQTPAGDCTGQGVWSLDDIECFVTSFLGGC